jgi:hypothetical protein
MGTLIDRSGHRRQLEQDHSVGRASNASLRIAERYVSVQHALLRWTASVWELKDLGSRNGTFLNGQRIVAGEFHALDVGHRIAFGKAEQEWVLSEGSAPRTLVVPTDDGDPIEAEGDLIAIPSPQDPSATVYRATDGSWMLEQDLAVTSISNQQTFVAGGKTWKFSCPDNIWKTSLATFASLEVRHLQLVFSVSRDEEHVRLQALCGTQKLEFGDRGHNYLLLTLARRRLEDVQSGLPEGSCGWVYQDDLAHDPSMAPPQLNIDVFRIRRQFAATGVTDAAAIIERRPRTKQLRIGAEKLSIQRL